MISHRAGRALTFLLDGGRIKVGQTTWVMGLTEEAGFDLCLIGRNGEGDEVLMPTHHTLGAFINLIGGMTDDEWTLAASSMALRPR